MHLHFGYQTPFALSEISATYVTNIYAGVVAKDVSFDFETKREACLSEVKTSPHFGAKYKFLWILT